MSKTNQYAIIQLLGKQHKVTEGLTFVVDRLDHEVGKTFDVKDVLLVANGEDVKIGTPLVEKAVVTLKVVEHGRGAKIRVATYKAKSKSRKVKGHKSHQSTLEVVKIK
jgi:large subunit ribosomal protein L21